MNILRLKLTVLKLILVGFSIFLMHPAMAAETGAAAENKGAINPATADKTGAAAENNDAWFTRRQKTIMLNVGAMGGVLLHGFINWDYGKDSFHFNNEGGFGRTTKYGGMDKLGHFWSSYSGSHLLGYVYREWGYSDTDANLYGALSSFGIQTFMEVADGFSGHGFSYEDFLANSVGACAGYIWGKYPRLAQKIDFRIEYRPTLTDSNLVTSWSSRNTPNNPDKRISSCMVPSCESAPIRVEYTMQNIVQVGNTRMQLALLRFHLNFALL